MNALKTIVLAFLVLFSSLLAAQSELTEFTLDSPSLKGNLLGDPTGQNVAVYLPDAYRKQPQSRFPVLYFLHGYSDPTPRIKAGQDFQRAMDALLASGSVQPMIIVLPNGINKYYGAFYANSSTTGNWDDYIVRDLVAHIDKTYRTLASPDKRGIVGHSMGGYGALTLAFRHPDVFGAVYAMSPCCTDLVGDLGPSNSAWVQIGQLQSPEQVPQALQQGQFFVAAMSALSASLAPNPNAKTLGDAPFYAEGKEIKTNASAASRISANMPANMVDSLLPKISQLNGIFIEYGAQENFTHIPIGAQELSRELSEAAIPHTLEVFEGDHLNRIPQRISERMLPWMSKQLNAAK